MGFAFAYQRGGLNVHDGSRVLYLNLSSKCVRSHLSSIRALLGMKMSFFVRLALAYAMSSLKRCCALHKKSCQTWWVASTTLNRVCNVCLGSLGKAAAILGI